jgi:hypothetical protein
MDFDLICTSFALSTLNDKYELPGLNNIVCGLEKRERERIARQNKENKENKKYYDALLKINKEYDLPELYEIIYSLEKQEEKKSKRTNLKEKKKPLKVICPEHQKECYIYNYNGNNNFHILVHGNIDGYGASIEWCEIMTRKYWIKLVEHAMKKNSCHGYPNEHFGGRTSDECFTVIDLVGNSNVCYCQNNIEAFKNLSVSFGENIINLLDDELIYEKEDDSQSIQNIMANELDYYTESFKEFVKAYHDRDDIPDLKYIYELLNHEKNDTQIEKQIEKQSTGYLRKIYGHE